MFVESAHGQRVSNVWYEALLHHPLAPLMQSDLEFKVWNSLHPNLNKVR